MKNQLLIFIILFFSILISSQQSEYKKFLDDAFTAIEKKDESNFLKNMKWFSTALNENHVTPEKLSEENLILYAKCIYWAVAVKDVNLPEDLETQLFNFMQYAANNYQDGKSMFFMGYLYESGKGGVNKDYSRAKYWYEEASQNGIPAGYRGLGTLYSKGWGVSQDFQKAFDYYNLAYKQGQQFVLPQMAYCKYKLEAYNESFPLLQKAVGEDKDNKWIAFYLGRSYMLGYGTPIDYDKATQILDYGCNANYEYSCSEMGWFYQYKKNDYDKAVNYYKKTLNIKHNDRAAYELGRIYYTDFDGENFDDNLIAYKYFEQTDANYNSPWTIYYRGKSSFYYGTDNLNLNYLGIATNNFKQLLNEPKLSEKNIEWYYATSLCISILGFNIKNNVTSAEMKSLIESYNYYQKFLKNNISIDKVDKEDIGVALRNMAEIIRFDLANDINSLDYKRYYLYNLSNIINPSNDISTNDLNIMYKDLKGLGFKDNYEINFNNFKNLNGKDFIQKLPDYIINKPYNY